MRPAIEKYLPDLEQIKSIRSKLKECKDEWLETKPGSGRKPANKYMGVNTVRQILDNAVAGATYWDSGLIEQWREEVYKLSADKTTWAFDGYVYHVRGYLFIPGLGHREQYGCKIAIGGKDNQDSAYKAAASNMLVKAASLFGVGESIYSKIKVETEADDEQAAYEQLQQSQNYQVQQQYQQPQQGYYQPPQQQYYQPDSQQQYPQPQGWGQDQGQTWAQPQQQQPQFANWAQQVNEEANGNFDANNPDTYPFNPHGEGTPEFEQWNQRHMATKQEQQPQATPQSFGAQPTASAEPQPFKAEGIQFGAPAVDQQPAQTQETKQEAAPQSSAIPALWPQDEIQKIHMHRARLSIQSDEHLFPYLREFLKKDAVSSADLTPDNLKDFNTFLEKFSA